MGLFDAITSLFSGGTTASLPPDKQHYVGSWQGPTTTLSIAPDGSVDYRQTIIEGSNTKTRTSTGPINGFDGDSFSIGVLGMNTVFHVQRAPRQDAGGWTMILDGEELRRVN